MIFGDHWMTTEKFERFQASKPILLVAYDGDNPVGFKAGFQTDEESFHSWLGGVHRDYRKQGIGQQLLDFQERLVAQRGIKRITFNTYARYSNMMRLGEKNEYKLIRTEELEGELKYFYLKVLTP